MGHDGLIRAFADDNGLGLRKCKALEIVLQEYNKYAIFSNLHLNLKKCYVVPLFMAATIEVAKDMVVGTVPEAAEMGFAWSAIYLGIVMGPKAGDCGWEAHLHISQWMSVYVFRSQW